MGDLHATKILPLLSWVIGSKVSCQRQIVPGVSHLPGVTLPMALSLSVPLSTITDYSVWLCKTNTGHGGRVLQLDARGVDYGGGWRDKMVTNIGG